MMVIPPPVGNAGFVSLPHLLIAWLLLPVATVAQMLPYIPTSIFLPTPKPEEFGDNATGSIAYVFTPRNDTVDLLALNTSATLVASSLTFDTISSGLPFLENNSTAFVPSLADDGTLRVYAGDCSISNSSGIWSLDLSTASDSSTAQWTQEGLTASIDAWVPMGPGFLGAGFSFSATVKPDTSPISTFVYGGMCPLHSATDPASSGQSDATYNNQMLKLSQLTTGSGEYIINLVDSNGPPIPEAGFTLTGLAPSYSNRSNTITQQRDYVVIGGHTQYAFINMSMVAVWSLPQENWSFVSDIRMAGSETTSAEMTIKETMESIDSRSGHSTVLNEDGTALVIFGGWVGDPTQAAFPQLAVLHIGWDQGGDGEWEWSIPDAQPSGNATYGHGATLLPGNVMMVYGGYSIPLSENATAQQDDSGPMAAFLNLTSMTWSDEYINPAQLATLPNGNTPGGQDHHHRPDLGLALGLGLGLGLTILPVLAWLLYRKLNKRRKRDSAIRALSQESSRFIGHDELNFDGEGNWYMGGRDQYARGNNRSVGYQSLQTGRASMENSRQNWFGDMTPALPPMLQLNTNTNTNRAARGVAPAPAYDPVGSPRGLGGMNPIFETDEEDNGDIGEKAMSPARDGRRDSGAYSDPFDTPTQDRAISFPPACRSSQTPSPDGQNRASVTDPDVQDWMKDIDAADALLSSHATAQRTSAAVGRSISRRGLNSSAEDFTESNAPETNRSNVTRSGSLLRQLRNNFDAAAAAVVAATTSAMATDKDDRGSNSGSSLATSSNTARTGFQALQAEGPGLLMGRDPEKEDVDHDDEPGSPSKNKPMRRNWLGSLRRVLTGSDSEPNSSKNDEKQSRGAAESNESEARGSGLSGIGGIAADVLSRRKSGKKAWESQEAGPSKGQARYAPLAGEKGEGEHTDDEEWDIEKAVEKRLVQFMFTVPKEPLRIVNAEPDFVSEMSVPLPDSKRNDEERPPMPQQNLDSFRKVTGSLRLPSGQRESPLRLPSGQRESPLRLPSGQREQLQSPKEGADAIAKSRLEPPMRLTPMSSFLMDDEDDEEVSPGSSQERMIKPSQDELRRELQREWERIEAEDDLPDLATEAPEPLRLRSSIHSLQSAASRRESLDDDPVRPSPLLNSRPTSGHGPGQAALTIEEQIHMLGTELHQARSAAQTPVSLLSHHSDADVLSAEVVRFERHPASTATLQITPAPSGTRNFRGTGNVRGRSDTQSSRPASDLKSDSNRGATSDVRSTSSAATNLRSEGNTRASIELRNTGNTNTSLRSEGNTRTSVELRNTNNVVANLRNEANPRSSTDLRSTGSTATDLRSEAIVRGTSELRSNASTISGLRGEGSPRASTELQSTGSTATGLRSAAIIRGANEQQKETSTVSNPQSEASPRASSELQNATSSVANDVRKEGSPRSSSEIRSPGGTATDLRSEAIIRGATEVLSNTSIVSKLRSESSVRGATEMPNKTSTVSKVRSEINARNNASTISNARGASSPRASTELSNLRGASSPRASTELSSLRGASSPRASTELTNLRGASSPRASTELSNLRGASSPRASTELSNLRGARSPRASIELQNRGGGASTASSSEVNPRGTSEARSKGSVVSQARSEINARGSSGLRSRSSTTTNPPSLVNVRGSIPSDRSSGISSTDKQGPSSPRGTSDLQSKDGTASNVRTRGHARTASERSVGSKSSEKQDESKGSTVSGVRSESKPVGSGGLRSRSSTTTNPQSVANVRGTVISERSSTSTSPEKRGLSSPRGTSELRSKTGTASDVRSSASTSPEKSAAAESNSRVSTKPRSRGSTVSELRSEANLRGTSERSSGAPSIVKGSDYSSSFCTAREQRSSMSTSTSSNLRRSETNLAGSELRSTASTPNNLRRSETNLGSPRESRNSASTSDLRSESNLRGSTELRKRGSTSTVRSVRAMVEALENKSSRDASPAGNSSRGGGSSSRGGTPSRGGASSRGGTPSRGSPVRGARTSTQDLTK